MLTSCVSIQLQERKVEKSKDVKFLEPKGDFKEYKTQSSDKTWISHNTGNAIAYFSECNDPSDASLSVIQRESLATLAQSEVIESKLTTFNDREALWTYARGIMEGIRVDVQLMIFKKNQCTYSLSYVGREKSFKKEVDQFDNFVKSFKAP